MQVHLLEAVLGRLGRHVLSQPSGVCLEWWARPDAGVLSLVLSAMFAESVRSIDDVEHDHRHYETRLHAVPDDLSGLYLHAKWRLVRGGVHIMVGVD